MPRLTASTGGIEIEDGEYTAEFLSVEETPPTPNSPSNQPFLKWTFQVYDSDEGQPMTQATSMKFGPKANARLWTEALMGRPLTDGEDVEINDLAPKQCRVLIEHPPESNGYARITRVMAPRKVKVQPTSTARVRPVAEEEEADELPLPRAKAVARQGNGVVI